jgi:hypothetical protein
MTSFLLRGASTEYRVLNDRCDMLTMTTKSLGR